jgi:uncharacterized protein YbjT (DUF2867 family)
MGSVFVSGGTGYLGRPLIEKLVKARVEVRALARMQSLSKLPQGCMRVVGDALDGASFAHHIKRGDCVVHLTGVAHPSPAKAADFRCVDLASFRASLAAAVSAGAGHFVYVSVAHPAPVMGAYIAVRKQCEAELAASGISWTVLRPWYVLGPGHWWPYLLLPLYAAAGCVPGWRTGAQRLGLVRREEMVNALAWAAVERPVNLVLDVRVTELREEAVAGPLRGPRNR